MTSLIQTYTRGPCFQTKSCYELFLHVPINTFYVPSYFGVTLYKVAPITSFVSASQNYVSQGQEVSQTGSGSSAGAIGSPGKIHGATSVKGLSNEQIADYIKVRISSMNSVITPGFEFSSFYIHFIPFNCYGVEKC